MRSHTQRAVSILALLFCLGVHTSAAHAQSPPAPKPPFDPQSRVTVQLTWDAKIPMRDGVRLSATIYRDPKQTKRVPVILTMTPYIAEHAAKQGIYFAQHGYVFVAIDSRGRSNSEGSFVPGRVEAKDGYDAIEWAARQPWCDGQVATWGGSWLGFTQWSIAKEFPPHLKAMAPTAAVYPGVDYPQRYGIFSSYPLRWLTYVHGRALNSGLFDESTLWRNANWEQVATGRAFQDLEEITGIKGTVFRTWLAHPREDAFWQAITPRPEHYAKLRIPILTITGHYDGDQLGALTYYERHMAYGPKEVTAKHWLVIGPWDHGGTRRPKEQVGGLGFGPSVVMSMEELHKAWYDHVLKGGPVPELLKDRVTWFVAGRNAWYSAPDLKQIEGAPMKIDLDVTGAVVGEVTRSGRLLAQAPAAPATIVLTSDPKYLPSREEVELDNPDWVRDQNAEYQTTPGKVVLHTAPFAAEMVLAGRPRLSLQVACDQPDADLFVQLFEVLPDGSAVYLAESAMRLRYRNGGVDTVLMTPDKPVRVSLPPMRFFARSIAKGSRLRLVIDSGPRFGAERNTHTGGDLASEPIAKGRIAHVTIMTGPDSGSVLEIPRPDDALLQRKDEPKRP